MGEDYYYHKLCTVLKATKSLKAKLVEDVDDASDCGTYVSDGEDDDWLDDHASRKRALKLHMHDGSLADARPWRSRGSHGNLFVDSKLVVREIASSDTHTIMDKQVPSMHLLESLRQADKSRWEDYFITNC